MNEIDEYISEFPSDVQQKLNEIRALIRAMSPDSEEMISYGMPAYNLSSTLNYNSDFN